jgi:acetylornithine deacetylase/succinyl-diaminopimelate desuccinylase-like protein
VEELDSFLRIPSVSGDDTHVAHRRAAAEWIAAFGAATGGSWEVREDEGLSPYAVGRLEASGSARGAPRPHVLLYGHADVQPAGDPRLWLSPPFEPEVRDGWLYARGVADDKGNVYSLVKGALGLVKRGALPVDVTVLVDTDEETSGLAAVRFLDEDATGFDACLVYDALTLRDGQLVFVAGSRGLVVAEVVVRTGEAEVHSGFYGGAALNAAHVLTAALARVIDLPEPLRRGAATPDEERLAAWSDAVDPEEELRRGGVRPRSPEVLDSFFGATYASPSIDVNGIATGDAVNEAMIIPCEARAHVSMRLALGQRPDAVAGALTDLLRAGAPDQAEVDVRIVTTSPGWESDTSGPVMRAVGMAVEEVLGRAPRIVPNGATVPLLAELDAHGIPAVLTGFATPASNLHGPDEGLPLNALALGAATSARSLELLAQALGLDRDR